MKFKVMNPICQKTSSTGGNGIDGTKVLSIVQETMRDPGLGTNESMLKHEYPGWGTNITAEKHFPCPTDLIPINIFFSKSAFPLNCVTVMFA